MQVLILVLVLMVIGAGCAPAGSQVTVSPREVTMQATLEATQDAAPTSEAAAQPTAEPTAQPAAEPTAEPATDSPPEPATEPPVESATQPPIQEDTASAQTAPAGSQFLVHLAPDGAPQQLGFFDASSTTNSAANSAATSALTPILELPASVRRVSACGSEATAPDQRSFAFFSGNETGDLYLMRGTDTPVLLDQVEALSCLGYGAFQFSPNSQRFGYIDYAGSVSLNDYAIGTLKLYDTATASLTAQFDNVATFDLADEGAIFVSFYTNSRREADEAAITTWDGSASREAATLIPIGDRCRFTSASLAQANDGSVALVMGQRCATGNTGTQWQFYTFNPQANSVTLLSSDYQPGAFMPYTRNNSVFFSPDSAFAYFTVPDGVTASTVAVAAVNMADGTISVPLSRQTVFPSTTSSVHALPQFSPDGRWLAAVVTSPNNDNQLVALDLTDPSVPPIAISAGSRGDVISAFTFTPDSARIVYVAGGTGGGENTLLMLDLALGTERRIARGHFGSEITISPDGTSVELLDWKRVEAPREPTYADLVRVNLNDSSVTTLHTGADVVEGRVTNRRTAHPLAWRESE